MLITFVVIIALIMSAVVHEVAHGWMAYQLGDSTAKDLGRLTLNPVKHLDWFGSIFVPLILVFSHSPFFIAWAKPVPFNPYRLSDLKYGPMKVALAGPGSNLILALGFGLLARLLAIPAQIKLSLTINFLQGNNNLVLELLHNNFLNSVFLLAIIMVIINLALMLFNLIPIPPLDGSKIIYTFLPEKFKLFFYQFERYSLLIIIILLSLNAFRFLSLLILRIFSLIVGI